MAHGRAHAAAARIWSGTDNDTPTVPPEDTTFSSSQTIMASIETSAEIETPRKAIDDPVENEDKEWPESYYQSIDKRSSSPTRLPGCSPVTREATAEDQDEHETIQLIHLKERNNRQASTIHQYSNRIHELINQIRMVQRHNKALEGWRTEGQTAAAIVKQLQGQYKQNDTTIAIMSRELVDKEQRLSNAKAQIEVLEQVLVKMKAGDE